LESALRQIADESLHRSETTRCANSEVLAYDSSRPSRHYVA
jgi:hypothetical protein